MDGRMDGWAGGWVSEWSEGEMDGWMGGWKEEKMDGKGAAEQQVQCWGVATGQWKADRPTAEGFIHPVCPAHPLSINNRIPQSLADSK